MIWTLVRGGCPVFFDAEQGVIMQFIERSGVGNGLGTAAAGMRRCAAFALMAAVAVSCMLAAGCATREPLVQEQRATVASLDGSRIAYGMRGEGEPTIVFIHGWLCNGEMWRSQIDHFSKEYKVAWMDLAGHGESGSERDEYSVVAFGHDVEAVVDKVPRGKLILVGHSMGGNVAIEAARLLGDRVAAIVAVDTFHTPLSKVPTEKKLQFVGWLAKDYPAALESTVESMFPPDADPGLVEATHTAMQKPDPHVGVNALRELILWNEHEESAGLNEYSDRLHFINAGDPGGKSAVEGIVLIPGTGHFVAQAAPNAFNAALEAIIRTRLAD